MEDNIKKAIREKDLSHPPMPKDLNARLMQRVEKEVNGKLQAKRKRIVWPWVAAACVAAMIMVAPQPPKGEFSNVLVAEDSVMQDKVEAKDGRSLVANTEQEVQGKKDVKVPVIKDKEPLLARTECTEHEEAECKVAPEVPSQVQQEVAVADNPAATSTAEPAAKPRVLTERDIPVTRPENLKYTKEELALMRRQANEAYLKWIELELEIARYNQEQTAER